MSIARVGHDMAQVPHPMHSPFPMIFVNSRSRTQIRKFGEGLQVL